MVTNFSTSESRTFSDDIMPNSSPKRWTLEVVSDGNEPQFLMLNCKGSPTTHRQTVTVGGWDRNMREFFFPGPFKNKRRVTLSPFSIKSCIVDVF